MNALEAVLLSVVLFLPVLGVVGWGMARQSDPRVIRAQGVVIVREEALESHAEVIGNYSGHEIWASVTFRGMVYRFDRVTGPRYRTHVHARELYLDPGLVYVTE